MSRGTDRYTARVDQSFLDSVEEQGKIANSGDDIYCLNPSANTPRRRITAGRLAQLEQRLTERDKAILQTLQHFRLANIAQLQAFHFHDHASEATGKRVARRTLSRLVELQAVVRLERRIGGIRAGSSGHIYTLSPVGHRLLGDTTRKRRHEPTLHHVKHTLAITDTAAEIHRASREQNFRIELLQTEPSCWRSSGNDSSKQLKPDLHIRLADDKTELSWFIEIDLATESSTVIARKLRTYTDYWRSGSEQDAHGVFPRVLWVVPSEQRAALIERTAQNESGIEPRLFTATTPERAISSLADFDPQGENQ